MEQALRGLSVRHFRVNSIHSQCEFILWQRQRATIRREEAQQASAVVSALVRRVATGSFSVSGPQNVSGGRISLRIVMAGSFPQA